MKSASIFGPKPSVSFWVRHFLPLSQNKQASDGSPRRDSIAEVPEGKTLEAERPLGDNIPIDVSSRRPASPQAPSGVTEAQLKDAPPKPKGETADQTLPNVDITQSASDDVNMPASTLPPLISVSQNLDDAEEAVAEAQVDVNKMRSAPAILGRIDDTSTKVSPSEDAQDTLSSLEDVLSPLGNAIKSLDAFVKIADGLTKVGLCFLCNGKHAAKPFCA